MTKSLIAKDAIVSGLGELGNQENIASLEFLPGVGTKTKSSIQDSKTPRGKGTVQNRCQSQAKISNVEERTLASS